MVDIADIHTAWEAWAQNGGDVELYRMTLTQVETDGAEII